MQVKLGLIQNDPATGATSPVVKRCIQLACKAGSGLGMRRRGTWARDEVAVQYFARQVRRTSQRSSKVARRRLGSAIAWAV